MAARRNSLIDGWKGIVVLVVLLHHLIWARYGQYFPETPLTAQLAAPHLDIPILFKNFILRCLENAGGLAVQVFVMISGFLITTVLLREEEKNGSISLGAFYVRRIFKIIPSLWLFMGTALILRSLGYIDFPNEAVVGAGTFLCNAQSLVNCTWWFGHTWTLSIQEQYYIVWPFLFLLIPRSQRALSLVASIIVFVVLYDVNVFPQGVNFACIAMGALCAVSKKAKRRIEAVATSGVIAVSICILLRPLGAYFPIYGKSVETVAPALLAIVLFGTLNGKGILQGLAASALMARIGVASYSLYLWQELFTARPERYLAESVLLYPILLVPTVMLSYFCVESRMVEVGRRISARLINRKRVGVAELEQFTTT